MAFSVRRIDYFHTVVTDSSGGAYDVLSGLADQGVNLVAITAIPFGPARTQLTVFPDDSSMMQLMAKQANIQLDGPYPALVVQGDDEVGALAEVHKQLLDANVHVFSSTGVTDGRGGYGYIIYVRPDEFERAAEALNI